eukprot:g20973.t1
MPGRALRISRSEGMLSSEPFPTYRSTSALTPSRWPSFCFPGDTRQAQADRAHHHFEDPAATAENSTATATAESFAATAEGEAATAKSQTPTAKGYAICPNTASGYGW